jgi:hypothetical protein
MTASRLPHRALRLLALFAAGAASHSTAAQEELQRTVTVDDSSITVRFASADFALGLDELTAWVGRRAGIVRDYYGRFPVSAASVRIRRASGAGVHGGREFSSAAPLIAISVGRDTTRAELEDDWVLVHEMIHLAFPEVAEQHAWLVEGLAVYVEGVARAQAGNITPTEFWSGLVADMPQGEPGAGDQGLDHTHSWGRTYWGGAIFCLQADVLIRERTANRKGLQDALRGVLLATGGNTHEWPIAKVLALADAATGTDVLSTLYREHSEAASPFDLDAIWCKLGIVERAGRIEFDDTAPLAAARRGITAKN